jgi:hypothetical protein
VLQAIDQSLTTGPHDHRSRRREARLGGDAARRPGRSGRSGRSGLVERQQGSGGRALGWVVDDAEAYGGFALLGL